LAYELGILNDAGACPQGHLEDNQGQRNQEQGELTS